MNSIQISIEASEEQQEILISQLEDLEATGFEQTQAALIAYFPENNFNSYEVTRLLQGYAFRISTIEEQNWNRVWESNFQPVVVGDFCAIRADFHPPISSVRHEIIITPKMSFGTGHHATTFMMMEQMKGLDFSNKTVFDFGTGTGILAILAEMLGAASVLAIDVDEWSAVNAKENIEKNKCAAIEVRLSSLLPSQQFDVILANINRNVILQYLPELQTKVNENGMLLLSGLMSGDEKDILEACSKYHFDLVNKTERNNWISLLLTKKKEKGLN